MKHKKIKFYATILKAKIKKIINLGKQPLANNLLINKNIKEYIPLELVFCNSCKLHNFLMTLFKTNV